MLAFSVADIMEAIDEIKPGAAAGPDDLPVLLLKKCKEALSKHIHMIWQHSMSTGTVPKFYKTSNNLLNSKQHGFRSGKSCLTQLLHHFDDIIEALSNGDDMDAIYLDYAKAFDKVDHQLLIKKLQIYGFHPKIIIWIE